MQTRALIKGVSVVVTALAIAFSAGFVATRPGIAQVASAQDATPLAAGQAVVTTADVLNVRSDASIDSDIVATLPNGTWATIVDGPVAGDDYNWYQIDYDEVTGWVAAEYLADAATAGSLASGATVIVNTEALNLRSAPGSTSDVVDILDGSTEGEVVSGPETADDMEWYQVDFDGADGWVSRTYLALPPAGEATVTSGVLATATTAATPLASAI